MLRKVLEDSAIAIFNQWYRSMVEQLFSHLNQFLLRFLASWFIWLVHRCFFPPLDDRRGLRWCGLTSQQRLPTIRPYLLLLQVPLHFLFDARSQITRIKLSKVIICRLPVHWQLAILLLPVHLVEQHIAFVTLITNAEEDEEFDREYAHVKDERSHDWLERRVTHLD